MTKIKVKQRDLFAAMHETEFTPDWIGFLHRQTGEILHLVECPDPADWVGADAEIDFVFDRARIDAAPTDWIEIPRTAPPDESLSDDEKDAAFDERVAEFFYEYAIDGELI